MAGVVAGYCALGQHDDSFEDVSGDWPVLVGVWADRTRVHRGRAEFNVDFIRDVPSPPERVLVARAIVSARAALDLRDQLDEAWRDYNRWSMPGVDS